MTAKEKPKIALPKGWTGNVRSAVLHVIGLAQYATVYTRSWASNSPNERMRLKAENDRLEAEVALLEEEIRIKDARLLCLDPRKRPQYPPTERMAILELRAARSWSRRRTAVSFHLTAATITSWMRRLDESGPDALVQLPEPVNKFPDFVRYSVQRLKSLCPSMGQVKIAGVLARAGLHLGSTTVGRIVNEQPPAAPPVSEIPETGAQHVTAKRPNHVWNVDLTTVPISGGFWTPWSPFTLPQCWPFCWWVAVVLDHYSRRVMGFAVFSVLPSSEDIQAFLDRTIRISGASPKHLISDKGGQFWCDGFKNWCDRLTIKPRFGAVGKHGSIAVLERFIGTMKREGTRRWLIPMCRTTFRNELKPFIDWYNEHRPHSALDGCTPYEVYHSLPPANRQPRCEPRPRWPRKSRCAKPQTLVAGKPGDEFTLKIDFVNGRKHLPIVTLKRAA
jgi:transposase InsO family protein